MLPLLDKITHIANKYNIKAYAVGGTVRDILLNKIPQGIDILVEGDGINFGKILQKEIGGKLILYKEFETCSLLTNEGKIDISTARKEKYEKPAKLPIVEKATIEEDLKRRDFTINAIAMELKTKKIIDPFNGRNDLKNKKIRILHKDSFIDDPTRIFRAVRFAGRLNFRLERKTKLLAQEAIEKGMIQKLTKERIRKEIMLILQEEKLEKIIKLMNKLKLLQILNLKLPEKRFFKNNKWFVYLLAIIDFKNVPFNLTNKEKEKIDRIANILENISKIKEAKKPSQCYDLLKNLTEDEILFITTKIYRLKKKIMRFCEIYKKTKLKVTGKDLEKLSIKKGPIYKKILYATLMEKIDGKLKNKKEEINFVKKYLKGIITS